MPQPIKTERSDIIAFLAGVCFFLSAVEYMLPRPVPFMRIGIANLPVIVALSILDAPSILLLVILKAVGQGIITGTLFSYVFLFSLAGSLASGLAMLGLSRISPSFVTVIGVSLGGALASNLAQILLARILLFGRGAWLIAPFMLITGIVSSLILGLFAFRFAERSEWMRSLASAWDGEGPAEATRVGSQGPKPDGFFVRSISAGALFTAGLASAAGYLFSKSLPLKAGLCGLFILLAFVGRKRVRILPSLIIFLSVVAFQLLSPSGRVVTELGRFKITAGALEVGTDKALTLVGMVFLSQFSVRKDLRIPGRFGSLLAKSFLAFERVVSTRFTPDKKDIIGSLDRYLAAAQGGAAADEHSMRGRTTGLGFAFLALLVLVSWSGVFAPLLF